ncbi:hypothetical protein NBRC116583_08670 [Arenicella sp. 4NH20-0111]
MQIKRLYQGHIYFTGGNVRLFLKFLTVTLLIVTSVWLYYDRDFEPLASAIGSLIGVIATFFFPEKNGENSTEDHAAVNGPTVVYKDKAKHKGNNNF